VSKRILDFHQQANRLFGRFLDINDYIDSANGVYDVIIAHRQIEEEGEIEKLIKYCKKTTKVIVDITTESGQIELFIDRINKIINNYPYKFILISDVPIKTTINCQVIDDYSLAFASHLNDAMPGRVYHHPTGAKLQHGIDSFNGSLRIQRLWLNYFFIKKFRKTELPLSVEFNHYINSGEGPKFNQEQFETNLNDLPKFVRDEVLYKQYVNPPGKVIDIEQFNDLKHHTSTVIIVSENTIGNDMNSHDDSFHITFTEKTIKPFVRGQIPLIHSYVGLQSELRELGFDLYDDFVNHSYENESDSVKRLEMIIDEGKRLLYLDTEKYIEENQIRIYKNKKLCEYLIWQGKTIIHDIIDTIILEK
jgi:hypothetical protein